MALTQSHPLWGWDGDGKQYRKKRIFRKKCLPGVETVPIPRGSILHATRPSQLPYNAKSVFLLKLYIYIIFLYIPYISPLKALPILLFGVPCWGHIVGRKGLWMVR